MAFSEPTRFPAVKGEDAFIDNDFHQLLLQRKSLAVPTSSTTEEVLLTLLTFVIFIFAIVSKPPKQNSLLAVFACVFKGNLLKVEAD